MKKKSHFKEGLTERFSSLSGAQKSWIGLAIILVGAALFLLFVHLLRVRLFEENPRFLLREIVIDPPDGYASTYWNAVRNREERKKELRAVLSLHPDRTNLFQLDLKELREILLREHPEIEKVIIRKCLPDRLVFRIHERLPVASIGRAPKKIDSSQTLRYLDETGRVFSAGHSQGISLPRVIDMAGRKEIRDLRPGDTARSDDLKLTLELLRMIRSGYPALTVREIVLVPLDNSIQCSISYRREVFTVILPFPMNREKLRNDIPARLIPALKQQFRKRDFQSFIDLSFEGQTVIRPPAGPRR